MRLAHRATTSRERSGPDDRDGVATRVEAVIDLLLEYDEAVDAAYLTVTEAEFHHRESLDDARGVNYAEDGSVIGIELLSPRRMGVVLDGLPIPMMSSE